MSTANDVRSVSGPVPAAPAAPAASAPAAPPLPLGATLGTVIGIFGWWIGALLICQGSNWPPRSIWMMVSGFCLSLALSSGFLTLLTATARRQVFRPRAALLANGSGMCLVLGVLLFFVDGQVLPVLLPDPDAARLLTSNLSALSLVPGIAEGLLVLAALLAWFCRREMR